MCATRQAAIRGAATVEVRTCSECQGLVVLPAMRGDAPCRARGGSPQVNPAGCAPGSGGGGGGSTPYYTKVGGGGGSGGGYYDGGSNNGSPDGALMLPARRACHCCTTGCTMRPARLSADAVGLRARARLDQDKG